MYMFVPYDCICVFIMCASLYMYVFIVCSWLSVDACSAWFFLNVCVCHRYFVHVCLIAYICVFSAGLVQDACFGCVHFLSMHLWRHSMGCPVHLHWLIIFYVSVCTCAVFCSFFFVLCFAYVCVFMSVIFLYFCGMCVCKICVSFLIWAQLWTSACVLFIHCRS